MRPRKCKNCGSRLVQKGDDYFELKCPTCGAEWTHVVYHPLDACWVEIKKGREDARQNSDNTKSASKGDLRKHKGRNNGKKGSYGRKRGATKRDDERGKKKPNKNYRGKK